MSEVLNGLEEVPHGYSVVGSTTPPNMPRPSKAAFTPNPSGGHLQDNNSFGEDISQPYHHTANPFDESADFSELDLETNKVPQNYQIKTGSRRGLLSRGYSTSEESLEHGGSLLSVIPEESLVEVQIAESQGTEQSPDIAHQSHDIPLRSHDVQQSHDMSQQSQKSSLLSDARPKSQEDSNGNDLSTQHISDGDNDTTPWYQETLQDDWQTTPAYQREELEETKKVQPRGRKSQVSKLETLVVTEEMQPVLQVSPLLVCLSYRTDQSY